MTYGLLIVAVLIFITGGVGLGMIVDEVSFLIGLAYILWYGCLAVIALSMLFGMNIEGFDNLMAIFSVLTIVLLLHILF